MKDLFYDLCWAVKAIQAYENDPNNYTGCTDRDLPLDGNGRADGQMINWLFDTWNAD